MFCYSSSSNTAMIDGHSTARMNCLLINLTILFILTLFGQVPVVKAEIERHLQVSELAPVGHQIGYVSDKIPDTFDRANYYIVFPEPNSMAEKVLSVNEKSGEIILQSELDYEKESKLMILAIPINGSKTIKVIIDVEDYNDHAPIFPVSDINLDISEYARIDTEFALPSAIDLDSEKYSIKKYFISSGNVNNVFRLATSKLNSAFYVDLVVNGHLDREYRDRYDLVVEVIDGGDPPKKGKLNVHIKILDANDNAPEFLQSRYSVQIFSNVSLDTKIATIKARDADAEENSKISYKFSDNQFKPNEVNPFKINSETGEVTVANIPLEPNTVYELIVVATDYGVPQALESTVFLTINVQNPNTAATRNDIGLLWLTEDGSPRISEGLTLGYVLARLTVRSHGRTRLSLLGSESLCLKQTDSSSVYLVLVCGPLDREASPEIHLRFTLKNENGDILLDHPVIVELLDINDSPPQWNQSEYRLIFNRHADFHQHSYRLMATDRDFGENARIVYSLSGTDLFQIDPETGLITAKEELDCDIGKGINFEVTAADNGKPSLSSSTKVIVDVIDTNGKPPSFDKSLYEVTIKEDTDVSTCIFQTVARDNSCGDQAGKLLYAFKNVKTDVFKLDSVTGKLCLQKQLDYESVPRYQLTIIATDSGGHFATTLLNVIVEDVNDGSPVFEPSTYNLTVYGDLPVGTALLNVQAIDHDVGHYGEIRYYMNSKQDYFHVDQKNGKLYSDKPLHELSGQTIDIKVWAKDSGGLTSSVPANVQIHVLKDEQNCPHFVKGLYEFTISEDILPGIVIGIVEAVSSRAVIYKIISGNDERFYLDSKTGKLSVAKEQDADSLDVVLLNIEARASDNCVSFSQVRIKVEDQNDNAPEFDMSEVETSVYEDFTIHEPFFAVQAIDKDKHENGKITYELIKSEPACPVIVRPLTGQVVLVGHLDFEKTKRYKLLIRAQDQGIPPKSSFTTIFLNVLDANDHAPEFGQQLYDLEVYENVPLMTTLIALKAKDQDSGENSDVRYRFADDTITDFGINHKTGEIFVKQNLDRETVPEYSFLVIAYDRGSPPMSTNASVHIRVLDINDNTPNCKTLEKMRISDDMEAKQLLGQLNAHDPDAGLNGTVVYNLQQLNEFIDVKKNGEVYLRKKLRGALRSSMQIAVIAEDQGPKPRPVVCTLLIDLDKTESDVKVSEPLDRTIHLNVADPVGTNLLKINATNAFSWNIENNRISTYFSVNRGIVSVANSIDETKFLKPQPLTIAIGDQKNRKLLLTFIIRLHHSSTPDNETIVVKVQETTPIGAKLFTLSTPEKTANNYYSVVKSNPSFEVNEATGQIYLAKRLEYNNASIMQLDMRRNNLQMPSKKKDMTLIFELDDVNNHSPTFTNESYIFEVLESTPVGAVIGRVEASDEDFGVNGAVKYRFIDSEETFSIDIETGEIFIQKPLYRHVKAKFYMTVEAEDCATLKDDRKRKKSAIFINVIDSNNNNPIFLSSTNITIHSKQFNQSEPIHYFVTIDMDSDENAQIKYKLIGGNENNDFHLDSTTGALYMKNLVVGPSRLLIRALDESSTPRFTDQSFTVYVDHTATEWKYFDRDSFVIELEAVPSSGSMIYKFVKEDAKERVEFHLLPENQKGFEIGVKDGILKTNRQVRNETHRFIVYAVSGQANSTDYAIVIVKFRKDTSFPPKIVQSSCGNISVMENRAVNDLMRIFAFQNMESTTPLFYHIESGADSLFQINETTGVIFCQELDREKKSEHFLIVSVSDNNVPKRADVCTVRVLVKDENDNVPKFDTTVPDIIEIGNFIVAPALILKLSATDSDEGENGKIHFKIIDDPSGSLDIDPDTGDLIFARDYSFSKSEYILKLAVEDCSRTNPLSSEKQIRVLWKRTTKGFLRGEPKFLQQKYITTVFEGLPKGTPILKIETSNKIFNDALLTLSIVEGNTDYAFDIDDDGNISTAEELDAEIQNKYMLKIMATGKFVKSSETIVEIHVLNTNDNVPLLPMLPDITLLENLSIGSLIASAVANDVDEVNNIEYSLDPINEYFYISKLTGGIYLQKPLDFEKETKLLVGIQAFDGVNLVKTNFTVNVGDVNDNSPKFQSDLLKINVPVFFERNTIIGKITATDQDQGSNGEIFYELLDGTKNLKIDGKTGELQLLSPVKINSIYFVTVKATDNGSPKLSSVATIKLKPVQNLNNQKPKFIKESFTFMVTEKYPVHLPFGKVEFTNSSNVALTILSQDYSDVFHISNNGELSLMMKLDREFVKEYRFQVALNYNGEDSVENDGEVSTIIVQVQDENDNAPIFTPESITTIKIDEQMRKGIIIGRLIATDADSGENGQVTYSIVTGNEQDVVRIESHSGAIMFDHWDDECLYENPGISTFNVTFVAEDNGSPSLWTIHKAQIVFNIENWSGSAPMFAVPLYHKYVAEDLSLGSVVLKVQAHNKWDYSSNNWRYVISGNDEVFDINAYSGEIILKGPLDYEKRTNYEFSVTVKDARHRSAIVPVQITVIGVDEFAPMFLKSAYTFEIPIGAEVGQRIGSILATDDDFGPDGKIFYSISEEEQNSFLGIDPDTGVLVLREPISSNKTVEQITVIASSGLTQHSRATVYIEMTPSESIKPSNIYRFAKFNKLTIIIGVLLFSILFLCCLIWVCIYLKTKNQQKPQKQVYSVSRGNVAVMADINRSSPSFVKMPSSLSYERSKTFSLISSNSSDRNSNPIKSSCTTDNFAARSQPDSGIDPDAISINSSVTDYLLQIGVTPVKLEQLNHFNRLSKSTTAPERIDSELGDLTDLIYAKVDEVLPPPRMAMSSYNPMELSVESFLTKSQNQDSRQEGLTYHPLTEVFTQISKMREDQNLSQQ